MKHAAVTLDDKWQTGASRVYLTATQALVRLPLLQRQRDLAAGLNTAGYVSGYRGSPLGQVDIQMWAARPHTEAHHIVFRPGVNEELAATAIWGSQQVPLLRGARYDGVFAYWYGKGPGVDRSGDVFRHANYAGTARTGGVLLIAGDDHGCKSSTVPHQSEPAFVAAGCPVLVPADLRDLLELGLHGWAMSRWSGRYVGFKTVAEVMDSSASVAFDLAGFAARDPDGPHPNAGIRLPDAPIEQEARVFAVGLPAAQAYARANRLDRIVLDPPAARLGIVTVGKSYHDTRQALAELGLEDGARAGIRLLKLALAWPVDPEIVRDFAAGLQEIVVVEEKAPLVEQQVRDILYGQSLRPRVLGKTDEAGAPLLRRHADLSAADIALALGPRIARFADSETLRRRLGFLREQDAQPGRAAAASRRPFFCSGCPHNTSTRVIEGSRALGGIGCHTLAVWMDRSTDTFSQMGGEGMAWLGQAPFTEERHVFANMGDGTYFHSGLMAIRAAAAAGVNITYKLLFNDAVAMTGGQPVEGGLTVPQLTRQLAAEGVVRIVVVTDEPEKHDQAEDFAPEVEIYHRRDMEEVERSLRDTPGCTVLIYDQTCASEKRRRRKRGTLADPPKRALINPAVCEGCGDCSRASNCLAVVPVETPFGTKRTIDQASCNKDFSCVEGFCPSFVTVHGAQPVPRARVTPEASDLPQPTLPVLDRPWNILVTGIGGTGVVTIGALLGMAAHAEGRRVTVLDQMGMAQKGGAVTSHIRIAPADAALHGLRLGRGTADLLLGCDLVVSAAREALAVLRPGVSRVVLNTFEIPTADFVRDADARLPAADLRRAVIAAAGEDAVIQVNATTLATALVGDAIAANTFLLGFAWQKGLVPVGQEALLHAIALNGAAVAANTAAFIWGRAAAVDLKRVALAAGITLPPPAPPTLDEIIATREALLTDYQSHRLARRYLALVDRVREAEEQRFSGGTVLTEAVARGYARVLAAKDEWEVARLYVDPAFAATLAAQFGEYERLEFHLAPPFLGARDPHTGHLLKQSYGGWMMGVFRVLAALRFLRGTLFDPFARSAERRAERALITEYEETIEVILQELSPATLPVAVALASLPERIRGFGHVKERSMHEAATERSRLLERLRPPAASALAAA
ncbi:Indolepyruvate ferredoxin oxidoreductase, alpha and beta subunits [Rhodovastum atsumiense]|uniref:Indolepyruvate ferredoxin oxidoreductase family protein n=1 Tax=Rhodovastum atsumiense TaxID=504468 RepID=A0A5M6IP83_9PROT|nr:indolepyruvate ferredoxin oxidoreductase family protein [Rhodovastum atsumiense]KAA5609709.1 indolepyruvate ferredoxin oxidoreductase family protein [Rhodovastum atsumiense]CAH2604478.1 Indolepyruvate ferredoxin oxidoreductase, alpha and beta subunits [Rhodovastum atsumiense]